MKLSYYRDIYFELKEFVSIPFRDFILIFCIFIGSLGIVSAQIELVKGLNNGDESSSPHGFVRKGNKVYFNLFSSGIGVTDLASNETSTITNSRYRYDNLISSGENIYVSGEDSEDKSKCLFKLVDDTLVLISKNLKFHFFKVFKVGNKEIFFDNFNIYEIVDTSLIILDSNISFSYINDFQPFVAGNKLYFFSTSHLEAKLWETNGEPNGVRLVRTFENYVPNYFYSDEHYSFVSNNNVSYFLISTLIAANSNYSELNLYKIENGNLLHVKKIKEKFKFHGLFYINNLSIINNEICFGLNYKEIWISKGSPEQTIMVGLVEGEIARQYSSRFVALGNDFYFFVRLNSNFKIFKTNGLLEQPTEVYNLGNYKYNEFPFFMQKAFGQIYFNKNKFEIWSTDGQNTNKLTDIIYPYFNNLILSTFGQIFPINDNELLFSNYSNLEGAELWKSNRDFSSKSLLKNLDTKKREGLSNNLTVKFKNKYFFEAFSEYGNEIFYTDGTTEGTDLLIDLNPNNYFIEVKQFVATENYLYFLCKFNNENDYKIYVTDGTREGTKLITYSGLSNPFVDCDAISAFGDELFFGGYMNGYFKYNPISNVSTKLDILVPITDKVRKSISFQGGILFTAGSFYFYNPQDGTISRVFNNYSEFPYQSFSIIRLYNLKNKVLLMGQYRKNEDIFFKTGLFLMEGTQPSINLIKEFETPELLSNYFWMTHSYDDKFFFRTFYDNEFGKYKLKFWVTDGTEFGTKCIDSLKINSQNGYFASTRSNEEVLIITSNFDSNINKRLNKIYLLNSDSLKHIKSYYIYNPGISNVLKIKGTYYMGFDTLGSYFNLWTTDGTPEGFHFLDRIDNKYSGSEIHNLREFDDRIVFFGRSENNRIDLYSYKLPICNDSLNYSIRSGNWNSKYTWSCGEVPNVNQKVLIKNGHKVNADSFLPISISNLNAESGSVLEISGGSFFLSKP